MKQPTVLVVVAWIFIIEAIAAIVPTARSLLVNRTLNLDLSLLGLWIGPGLLRGEASFRRWALFILRLDAVLGAIALLFFALAPSLPPITVLRGSLGFLSRGVLVATIALVFIGTIWQLRVLQRPDIRQLFENPLRELPPRG
jgi:hypothetical protein